MSISIFTRTTLALVAAMPFLGLMASANAQSKSSSTSPLIIISIDGMKPEYVTHADEHGLKVPELRTFLTDGTYAEGVVGVIPTVTYPSHTTLVTGVWPAEHGIYANTTFDPLHEHPGQWYWDFSYIKVETLYQAADKAGLKTAAVSWPVTVGAPIDYLIAEGAQSEKTDKPSGPGYNPLDILDQLGVAQQPDGDELKTKEAIGILNKWKPSLMLVHLVQLDHEEHQHGPFSDEANATIEKIDADVHQIEQAALAINQKTRIAIVSDHGFLPVEKHVNLNVLFVKAGLITLGDPAPDKKGPTIKSWDAEVWASGGSDAIVLRDPNDKATLEKVRKLLEEAKANPEYGIDHLLTHDELAKRGGFPPASFLIDYQDGFASAGALTGKVVKPAPHTGTHGYLPSRPALRSTFMIKGAGIAKGRDVQVIDMRQIAPTFAELLHVSLPDAKQPPVYVQP